MDWMEPGEELLKLTIRGALPDSTSAEKEAVGVTVGVGVSVGGGTGVGIGVADCVGTLAVVSGGVAAVVGVGPLADVGVGGTATAVVGRVAGVGASPPQAIAGTIKTTSTPGRLQTFFTLSTVGVGE